jgi:simple sugar transport system ATP-binding protein
MGENYAIEMLNITKRFPGIVANDDITLRLKKGEIHALLGENGAGKSTLMSVLFGLYQAEAGIIKKDGKTVEIRDPNDANALGIGMVHQHFKLVDCFTVLDNIILGVEPCKMGFLQKKEARQKVVALSEKYGLFVDPDRNIEDITVGMQQRTEILKMLYRDNEILIFDEPTAVLTPRGNRRADEDHEKPRRRGQVHPVHLPQADRDHGRVGPVHGAAQGQMRGHGGNRPNQF